jgi:hypothetical protein
MMVSKKEQGKDSQGKDRRIWPRASPQARHERTDRENAMEPTGTHASRGSIRKRNLKGKASTAEVGFNRL